MSKLDQQYANELYLEQLYLQALKGNADAIHELYKLALEATKPPRKNKSQLIYDAASEVLAELGWPKERPPNLTRLLEIKLGLSVSRTTIQRAINSDGFLDPLFARHDFD